MSFTRLTFITGFLVVLVLCAAGCTQPQNTDTCSADGSCTGVPTITGAQPGTVTSPSPATSSGDTDSWKKVRLETDKGNIVIALDPEMPITAGNFETLAKEGYYDGVIFHRVIKGFMIQSGDPTGTGRGGPGYTIRDEFTSHNRNSRGAVAMANTGQPNSGGSQFFINLVDNSPLLSNTFNSNYPVFGTVVEGMDVVDTIAKVPTTGYPSDRPLENVTIIRAVMV